KKWDAWRSWLKWWDVATGREVASFPGDRNAFFSRANFSPDGGTLAVSNWQGDNARLMLFHVADKRLVHAIVLGKKREGERMVVYEPVFRPDGKSVAVITQQFPENSGRGELDVRDVPQPRIHLIDVAAGDVRETLVAPQSFMRSACFSPDGRTLATGGQGKVL